MGSCSPNVNYYQCTVDQNMFQQSSEGVVTQDEYYVLLPDDRRQVVSFYDDGTGYHAPSLQQFHMMVSSMLNIKNKHLFICKNLF